MISIASNLLQYIRIIVLLSNMFVLPKWASLCRIFYKLQLAQITKEQNKSSKVSTLQLNSNRIFGISYPATAVTAFYATGAQTMFKP